MLPILSRKPQLELGDRHLNYVAFISYKHSTASRPHAERIESALKRYSKPFWKPPIAIFRDERILRPGDDLPSEIRKALTNSKFLLYLASKEAAQSRWVQDELRIWCQDLDRAKQLLIVHIADLIAADSAVGEIVWDQTDALPELLKPYVHSIPIWTDLSWATTVEQRDLNNVEYKRAINAITARFRGTTPGEMNDQEVITHRRNVLLRNTGIAVVLLLGVLATYLGVQARRDRNAAEKSTAAALEQKRIADGQRDVAREQRGLAEQRARSIELAEALRQVRGAPLAAAGRFRRMGLDPMMALHSSLAKATQELKTTAIVGVEGEVSFIRVSRDGDLVVVVYNYQNFGGNPDIETIPDWTAVSLYRLSTRQWVLKHRLDSAIGRKVYEMYAGDVIGLESPHSLILSRGRDGAAKTLLRFSLLDGSQEPCDLRICGEYAEAFGGNKHKDVPKELFDQYLEPSKLFRTLPADGIDVEYGPRLVDDVFVRSPDRRTALVGTYEGRLLLLDLASGRLRGEQSFSPIFAAAYQQDGKRAFFTDRKQLFEIDTSGWPGIREISSPLRTETGQSRREERVLAASLSEDTSVVAMATTRRLLGLIVGENRWIAWELPKEIKRAAALRVDHERHVVDLVVGDDGTLMSGDYRQPAAPLKVSSSATGGHPTIAWLDTDQPGAWLSQTKVVNGAVGVRFVPMPGRAVTPREMSIGLLKEPTEAARREQPPMIHALAKIEDQLILFYGDTDVVSSDRELWDEQMTVVSLSGREQQTEIVIFKAKRWRDNLGEDHWNSDHVTGLLPGSRKGRILALTSGRESVLAVKPDGSTEPTGESLSSREYVDSDQVYAIGISGSGKGPSITIRHSGSNTILRYLLPWSFEAEPGFAAIGRSGRQAAVVSTTGDVLFVDVSAFAAQSQAAK